MTPEQEAETRDAIVPHLEAIKALIKGETTIAVVILTPGLADPDVIVTDESDINNVLASIYRRFPEAVYLPTHRSFETALFNLYTLYRQSGLLFSKRNAVVRAMLAAMAKSEAEMGDTQAPAEVPEKLMRAVSHLIQRHMPWPFEDVSRDSFEARDIARAMAEPVAAALDADFERIRQEDDFDRRGPRLVVPK